MNFPNILSLSRILLSFPVIIFFEYGYFLFSLFIFFIASITDFLDGFVARKQNQTSELGALLDLIADKLFVSILLIWMTFIFDSKIIFISSLLIISREIIISYLRLYFITKSLEVNDVKADFLGKFKTSIQMIGLGLVLISPIVSSEFFLLSLIFLLSSAVISWVSLFKYIKKWNEK